MTPTLEPIIAHSPTRPPEIQPEAVQRAARGISLISIYPQEMRAKRRHGGYITYTLPAAPRGSYSKLVVYDTFQWIKITSDEPGNDKERDRISPAPVSAEVVAADLVSTWALGTLGARSGYRPGIAVIRGENPTPEELGELRFQQDHLFNWYITNATGYHVQGKGGEITDIHRLAARYMLDKGAEQLPWFPITQFEEVKDCIACGKQIMAKAIRCQHCTTMLPAFYIEFGIQPENDAAVSAFMERMKGMKQAHAPTIEEQLQEPKNKEPRLVHKQ